MPLLATRGAASARGFGMFGASSAAAATDPYFNLTTLLLPGNGTNGAQNNTFLDSSTNNFTITRNGNTTQGTFSPFSQTGWSNYFDGSGDYLTVPDNAAWDLGSSNFTIESWVYPTASPLQPIIIGQWTTSYSWVLLLSNNTNRYLRGILYNGSFNDYVSTSSLTLNAWNHCAMVRESNTVSLYLNGSRVFTTTFTGAVNTSTSAVSIGANASGADPYTGYLSNARVVIGTALYSGVTYTVPTAPLTAISGTSLLTCQSNRFIDNSTNNFTITRNGDVSVQAFSPFAPTAAYSSATVGGSGYFDGTVDNLSLATITAVGNSNVTIEFFIYPTSGSITDKCVFDSRSSSSTTNTGFAIFQIGTAIEVYGNGLKASSAASALIINQWNHVAVTRLSGSCQIYVNGGASGSSGSYSDNLTSTIARIGDSVTVAAPYIGYISNLRVVIGSVLYSGSYTVPTAPLTAITNTSLLLNFTNAGITDATAKNDLETVGNAQISTAQSKWGGSSMLFDGTGDYLVSPYSTLLDYGSGNATIEFWMRPSSTAAAYQGVIGKPDISVSRKGWAVFQNGTTIRLFVDSSSETVTTSSCLTLNTWTYIAVVKSGTTWTVYAGGVNVGSGTAASYVDAVKGIAIGEMNSAVGWNSTFSYTGYIQDLRITKGYARYTANFTSPSSAFPLL